MELREVKQQFFALRNGLLADMLRKQCQLTQKVIFGLNLPQIRDIALRAGEDAELASRLWADVDCRESRLLAPMVRPADAGALAWLGEVLTVEEADVVCHRLLCRCPGALDAARAALADERPLVRYAALRLLLNLLPAAAPAAAEAVATVPFHPLTDAVVRQLRSELADAESL